MGGKGRRRREKNYRAAHGADARLPPPPKLKELEAVPSKLRRLIKLRNTNNPPDQGRSRRCGGSEERGRKAAGREENKDVRTSGDKVDIGDSGGKTTTRKNMEKDETADLSIDGVQKGKRKRLAVTDLRFQDLDQSTSQSRKKKRKEYFEAKRKKSKKQKTDDILEFPGREEIKFGEIVDAPLNCHFRSPMDASLERHRLQAIENYRNQRGWSSRPGIKLPSLAEDLALCIFAPQIAASLDGDYLNSMIQSVRRLHSIVILYNCCVLGRLMAETGCGDSSAVRENLNYTI
uniref:Uncharacterized protein n=1 Tax=Ananas comosus var. bracteatus TaxID=296719 RepID=A0A6V7PHI0_ANACO|nr:unnamed protein product [Ananas comosus var. bracteatus]